MLRLNCTLVVLMVFLALGHQRCLCSQKSYSGYSVFRCWPQTDDQLAGIQLLTNDEVNIYTKESSSSHATRDSRQTFSKLIDPSAQRFNAVEFWSEPNGLNDTVDILVAPQIKASFQNRLDAQQIPCQQTIGDVDQAIKRTFTSADVTRDFFADNETLKDSWRASERFYKQYHPYAAIESKLMDLAKADPRVSLETIGYSYEQRKIYLVKFSTNHSANKPVVFIDAGHHAREWVSHSTAIYLLESLINIDIPKLATRDCASQSCREELSIKTRLDFDRFDYWFLPIVNPDGYEHTHTEDRLWRKTRSKNSGICFAMIGAGRGDGVDPNRNYPYHWMEAGASSFACSETYAGPKPLSEPETAALAKILDDNKNRIVMYISFHSFSQLILVPYGYGRVYPDNYDQLKQVAESWIQSVAKLRGTVYEFGPSAIKLYPAAGGSDDYAHGVAGIKLAYTIELPDRGQHHFLLPPSEIVPVGQEAVVGLRAMTDAAFGSN